MEASVTNIAAGRNKPETAVKHRKRAKILIYGEDGTEKTRFSLQWPKPFVIDMEQGTDWYRDEFPDAHFEDATTPEEVDEYIEFLLKSKHQYKTLTIDPVTIWSNADKAKWNEVFMKRNKGGVGYKHEYYDTQPKDYGTINSSARSFLRKLTKLDMHVILTSHEVDEYAKGGFMKVVGRTWSGPKGLNYWADTRLWFQGGEKGNFFTAKKDRAFGLVKANKYPIDYSLFESALGKVEMERESSPLVMSTRDQQIDITHYVNELSMTQEQLSAALRKYDVAKIDELTYEDAETILNKLKEKK